MQQMKLFTLLCCSILASASGASSLFFGKFKWGQDEESVFITIYCPKMDASVAKVAINDTHFTVTGPSPKVLVFFFSGSRFVCRAARMESISRSSSEKMLSVPTTRCSHGTGRLATLTTPSFLPFQNDTHISSIASYFPT